MKFRTQIPLEPQKHHQIDYDSQILLLGSCFAEHIGEKFTYYKFRNTQNPFGILFHPFAIETFITNVINEKVYTEADLVFQDELWHCFDAHSKLSSTSKEEILTSLNESVVFTLKQLKAASHIVLTFGTAWVYRYIETDAIVANCHKIPQKKFLKTLLTVEEISQSIQATVSLIKSINPSITTLFSVSPVRHIKDGMIENTQSKAHLIAAIHQYTEPRQKQFYMPSYEIMMDELRDYRFYDNDMLHPSPLAIEYIWERFKEVWIANKADQTMRTVEAVQKGLHHRPFHSGSLKHQEFLKHLASKKALLKAEFPHIEF